MCELRNGFGIFAQLFFGSSLREVSGVFGTAVFGRDVFCFLSSRTLSLFVLCFEQLRSPFEY